MQQSLVPAILLNHVECLLLLLLLSCTRDHLIFVVQFAEAAQLLVQPESAAVRGIMDIAEPSGWEMQQTLAELHLKLEVRVIHHHTVQH